MPGARRASPSFLEVFGHVSTPPRVFVYSSSASRSRYCHRRPLRARRARVRRPELTSSPHTAPERSRPQTLCPTCGGRGWLLCPACGGAGTYSIIGYGGYMEFWPCSVCMMTGRITCYTCLGTGLAPAAPYMVMNPTSMTFSATVGGGNPSRRRLPCAVPTTGNGGLGSPRPRRGLQVSFNAVDGHVLCLTPQTAGLAPGTYTTNVLVEMWSDGIDGTPVQGSPLHVPVTFVVNPAGTVAAPTFTPNGGTFSSAQPVTISCATAGAHDSLHHQRQRPDRVVGPLLGAGQCLGVEDLEGACLQDQLDW